MKEEDNQLVTKKAVLTMIQAMLSGAENHLAKAEAKLMQLEDDHVERLHRCPESDTALHLTFIDKQVAMERGVQFWKGQQFAFSVLMTEVPDMKEVAP